MDWFCAAMVEVFEQSQPSSIELLRGCERAEVRADDREADQLQFDDKSARVGRSVDEGVSWTIWSGLIQIPGWSLPVSFSFGSPTR